MERSEKDYVISQQSQLIQLIMVTDPLLAGLEAATILGSFDVEKIVSNYIFHINIWTNKALLHWK